MDEIKKQELTDFLGQWKETPSQIKRIFLHYKDFLEEKNGVTLDFIPRPGITYSLRAVHENQCSKELFVMVDVIDDDSRWISICFYHTMISDPEEEGDWVPGGLLGEDALCFDLDKYDETLVHYLDARLEEAWQAAQKR